jgi:AraC-like DNA-binding protein
MGPPRIRAWRPGVPGVAEVLHAYNPQHRYLVGRRFDAARRLLAGERPADVAVAVGFHDQAHLTRHFRLLLGVPPGEYVRSAACP